MVNGVISNAVSGLLAQSRAIGNVASNVSNVSTIGSTAEEAYQPVDTKFTSQGGGGVQAQTLLRDPATVSIYAPDNSQANADGYVFAPNVDIGEELISAQIASTAYQANAAVIRVDDEIAEETLNLIS